MPLSALVGRRVLLLEDEMLISLLIEDVLERQGCTIVGPFSRVAEALSAAATETIDVAILDINVGGVKSFPVAETLSDRNIPFFFLSGYGQSAAPSDRPDWIVRSKPFEDSEIIAALVERLGQ